MRSYQSHEIRNIVLVSHGGAGKTSLAEAMLFDAGVVSRLGRVDDGNTTSDYDPDEVRRRLSINLALLPFEFGGAKINLIDTPGYADFVGEVLSGARVADAAVMVVCGASGIEVGTELTWGYLDTRSLPRLVYVNKLDRENANFERTLEQLRQRFGNGCVAVQLPIGSERSFRGVIDLLAMTALTGVGDKAEAVTEALAAEAASWREKLIEAIAETDDDLLMKYLDGEELTTEELVGGLRAAVAAGRLTPVLAGSALHNVAVTPLLRALVEWLPSAATAGAAEADEMSSGKTLALAPDGAGPLAALVFKTMADPFVGKLSYFRVFSGTLASNSEAWNSAKGRVERIGQVLLVRGKTQEPIEAVAAGDIGAITKLVETSTGDTLCHRDRPLALAGIHFPAPVFTAAVQPKTKADVDKLSSALTRLAEEDLTLHVRKEPDTGEVLVDGLGESHIDIAAEKMRRKFGVDVLVTTPRVSYKETVSVPTKAEYKHKKQTGGHGQYGHVLLEIEPLPRGSGFEFSERVVGGVVPRNYIPAVEKGVRSAIGDGVIAHYPVVDVKVTLYDGSYHSVDSSDISFQIAAQQALKKGLSQARPVLLEPIMAVSVRVPEAFMGDTISSLNGKRARVLGANPDDGMSVVDAHVPLAEMLRYATELRSITQGRGSFTMEFSHYEEVPDVIAQKVVAEAKRET